MQTKLLVLDVDGTLTDGGLYLDSTGNETKKFTVKDGAGLVIARTAGIKVMILTGRESEPVRRRPKSCIWTTACRTAKRRRSILPPFWPSRALPGKRWPMWATTGTTWRP